MQKARLPYWIWALVLALVLSVATALTIHKFERVRNEANFQAAALERMNFLSGNINITLIALTSLGAYFDASPELSRDDFHRLSQPFLNIDSPIQALEWIPHASQAQRSSLEHRARVDGMQTFSFREKTSTGVMAPAPERDEYYPVYYVEPLTGNEKAVGFNLASNPERRAALMTAIDTGKLTATARITLVQEKGNQYGFLAFRPVFAHGVPVDDIGLRRKSLVGFVLGVIRIGDVVAGAEKLGGLPGIALQIDDEDAPEATQRLFPRDEPTPTAGAAPPASAASAAPGKRFAADPSSLVAYKSIVVAGRHWRVTAHPVPGAFLESHIGSVTAFFLGAVLSAMLGLYLRTLFARQAQSDAALDHHVKELNQERNFHEALFTSAPALILVIDPRCYVVRFNSAAESFTGFSAPQVMSEPYFWRRFDADGAKGASAIETCIDTLETRQFECSWRDAQGRPRNLLWTASSIRSIQGEFQYLVLIGSDVTRQKQAEQALQAQETWLCTTLESLGEGVCVFGPDGRARFMNAHATLLLGWELEDLRGQGPGLLVGRAVVAAGQPEHPMVRAMRAHQGYRSGDETFLTKTGAELPVKVSCSAMSIEGRPAGWVLVFSDVRDERELQRHLVAAKEAAEGAARLKAEFLSTMSHEIRTPLNGVIGMANILADSTLDHEQQDYVRIIRTSADALNTVIDDILDFSKIEAGRLEIESIAYRPQDSLRICADIVAQRARDKGLSLVQDLDPALPSILKGDPARVRQVLLNFLSNAVKFSDHGHITLRARRETLRDPLGRSFEVAALGVQDEGIGLSDDAKRRLFQPFMQADNSTSRKYGGTGLGLAICKRLVEAMGGVIRVDSQLGAGSSFTMLLPLTIGTEQELLLADAGRGPRRGDAMASAAAAPIRHPQAAAIKLLLVEDNPINQRVALILLNRAGYRVDVAVNGREAIQCITEHPYDLVLMDCQMPEMDGFAATREIRRMEADAGRHVPIIAMTANAMDGDRERCLAAGMDDYLRKPIDEERLREVLAKWSDKLGDRTVAVDSAASSPVPHSATPTPIEAISMTTPAETPAMNWQHLQDMLDGDVEMIRDLAGTFRASLDGLVPKLQALMQAPTTDDAWLGRVRELAHEVKGMSANMGAESLAAVAATTEKQARAQETDALRDGLPPLLSHIERVQAALDDIPA
jgi:PAS domain S-box-containing protein